MRRPYRWAGAVLGLVIMLGLLRATRADQPHQLQITATPVPIDLGNAVPEARQLGATLTPTRTPTPLGPVQIEALEVANVRAQPDTSAELLGQIRPGEFYNVIRQYFRWIEFQYDPAPSRRGWVFEELVRIVGDPAAIVQVDSLDAPVEGAPDIEATVTNQALTQTPGGLLTATYLARVSPAAPIGIIPGSDTTPEAVTQVALPTFTFPPGILPLAPTEAPALPPTQDPGIRRLPLAETGAIPPIAPVAALFAVGLLGLIISSLRR